jgi:hypothetical protein
MGRTDVTNVTVYKVQLYNAATDNSLVSTRMATVEGAEIMGGHILKETAVEIDSSQLESGEQWTPRGFNPHASVGFQTSVRA